VLTADLAALAADIAVSVVPVSPRYIADDCTPEQLTTMLQDQGGRIAVLSPEGDVFDLIAGRYSPTASANFLVFLKGHAGDQLRVDRVRRAPEFIDRPALTVGLAVQPDVIRGLMDKPGFRERGLLGRVFYSLPDSLLGHRDTDPPPIPSEVRAAYRSNMRALLRLPLQDKGCDPRERELILDSGARARILEYAAWIEPQLSEFGELGSMRDWAGKLVGAVARIAGILHMAAFAGRPAPWDSPISLETVNGAIQIGGYLIPHAKAAFAEMGADPHVGQAKLILRWIEQKSMLHFTKRDLHQALRGRFKRVEDLERPLEFLISQGFIRTQEEVASSGPGRKRSPVFDVNPTWNSQNAARAQGSGGTK
jgi:hypothetical protein